MSKEAKEVEKTGGVLKLFGELDTLYYYSQICPILKKFVGNKEIATIVYIPNLKLLRRATKLPAIYVKDIKANDNFLRLRAKGHLDEVRGKLSKEEIKIWGYFFPRKMVELHYAVNSENTKADLDRVYFDIDKGNLSSDNAKEVAIALIQIIKKDKTFPLKYNIKIIWTGRSFHVYLLFGKKISHAKYVKLFQIKKDKKQTFIEKWADEVNKLNLGRFKVSARHEKAKNTIIIDSSQSPPGKLGRCPFSLHVKNYKEYDGISVPVSEQQLKNKNLIEKLKKLTPEAILKDLRSYGKLLI